eukprot:Nk52_evm29s317 gene=Nk52_evmTU29s317
MYVNHNLANGKDIGRKRRVNAELPACKKARLREREDELFSSDEERTMLECFNSPSKVNVSTKAGIWVSWSEHTRMPSQTTGGSAPASGSQSEWTRCPAEVSEGVEEAWQEFLEAIRRQVEAAIAAAAKGAIERDESVGGCTLREYVQGVDFANLPRFQEESGSSEPNELYPTRLADCHAHMGRMERELTTWRENSQNTQTLGSEQCWTRCHSFPFIDDMLTQCRRLGMRRTLGERSLHGVENESQLNRLDHPYVGSIGEGIPSLGTLILCLYQSSLLIRREQLIFTLT